MKNKSKNPNPQRHKIQLSLNLYKKKLEYATKLIVSKANQLEDIKDKVKRSEPILQIIYSKIKKRQQFFKNKIDKEVAKNEKANKISQEYMSLHELGIKIIESHGLLHHFQEVHNYATKSTNIPSQKISRLREDIRKYIGKSESRYINDRSLLQNSIVQAPMPQPLPKPFKTQTVYDIYQQKLQNEKVNQNPQSLRQQVKQFSVDVSNQIEKIKQLRAKVRQPTTASNRLKKSNITVSETRIKKAECPKVETHQEQEQQQPYPFIKEDRLKKFQQIKRRNLQKLREQKKSEESIALSNLKRAIMISDQE